MTKFWYPATLKADHSDDVHLFDQVIKPPLCFSESDADTLIFAMDRVLHTLGSVDKSASRTPT